MKKKAAAVAVGVATYAAFAIQGFGDNRELSWPASIALDECHDGELNSFAMNSDGSYTVKDIEGVIKVSDAVSRFEGSEECAPIVDTYREQVGKIAAGTVLKGMCHVNISEGTDNSKFYVELPAPAGEATTLGYVHLTENAFNLSESINVPQCK